MLAFGYVKMTTPASLSATSCASVVFTPSFVSTSPPKLGKSMVEPTAGGEEVAEDPAAAAGGAGLSSAAVAAGAGAAAALDLEAPADFFFAGGGGAAGGALRLRSSTMLSNARGRSSPGGQK